MGPSRYTISMVTGRGAITPRRTQNEVRSGSPSYTALALAKVDPQHYRWSWNIRLVEGSRERMVEATVTSATLHPQQTEDALVIALAGSQESEQLSEIRS
jgi:hypothetical protein